MFIFISCFVLHTVFVNAKYFQAKYPQTQNSILSKVFTATGIDLNSLKQLARAFPHHAIEIQAEGNHAEPDLTPNQQMDLLRQNHNFQKKSAHPIERIGEKIDEEIQNQFQTSTTTMSTTTDRMNDFEMGQFTDNHRKRPLYMEDLIQALEDFGKKTTAEMEQDVTSLYPSTSTSTSTPYNAITDNDDPNRPLVQKDLWELKKLLSTGECKKKHEHEDSPSIKDFNDVLKLINKGVRVQLEVTTPADADDNRLLDWVPIKIPKDKYK